MALSKEQVEQLKRPLDKDRVKQRSESGRSLSYIEGYDAIDVANEIFGFDGWSYEIQRVWQEIGIVVATVRVEVAGAFRTDVGIGIPAAKRGEDPSMSAWETAYKGAVTDALKRALRTFGDQFGNSLYDKESELHQQTAPQRAQRPAPARNGQSAAATTPPPNGQPPRFCPVEGHEAERLQYSQRTKVWGHVQEDGTPCVVEAAQEAK